MMAWRWLPKFNNKCDSLYILLVAGAPDDYHRGLQYLVSHKVLLTRPAEMPEPIAGQLTHFLMKSTSRA